MRIPAFTRLKLNRDFGRVYRRGQYQPGRHIILHAGAAAGDEVRLGVAVSKKVRGAVRRNRLKRRLRDAFRRLDAEVAGGHDLILTAKEQAADAPFDVLQSEIKALLAKARLLTDGR